MSATWWLLRGMVREEWRLHSELFGGRRFAAFPLVVLGLAAVGAWLLRLIGTPPSAIVAGTHALVFVFGMHVGTIGLVGHDSLQNLLGEVTLLLSTSRTLPLSPRRLLGVFLLKDVLYYVALFLAPMVGGLAVGGGFADTAGVPVALFTLAGTLALGFAVVFAGIALRTRGRAGNAALLGGIGAITLAWATGVDLLAWTPYALVAPGRSVAAATAARALLPVVGLVTAGLVVYDPTYRKPARRRAATFATWRRRLRDGDGLLTKSLFDVARSGGGLAKVPFSAAIVLAIAVATVEFTSRLTGRPPAPGITLGSLLGLTAFTTYNWLAQFDDPDSYLAYPLSIADVLGAKYRAFLVLGPPVGLAYYLPTAAWYGTPPAGLVAGAGLLLGLQGYLFGITVHLTGLQPGEFLFDTVLFAGFTVAVAAALVPVLVAGLVLGPVTAPPIALGFVAAAALLGVLGAALASRARGRWTRRYRRGY